MAVVVQASIRECRPDMSSPGARFARRPGPKDQSFLVTTAWHSGCEQTATFWLSENWSVKVAQRSASVPGVARGGFLVGSGIGCGVLLGLNDVTWALAAAAAAGLALALVCGVDVERAALTTAAMFVSVIGATALLVWFGPWAWSTVARSAAPVYGWAIQTRSFWFCSLSCSPSRCSERRPESLSVDSSVRSGKSGRRITPCNPV